MLSFDNLNNRGSLLHMTAEALVSAPLLGLPGVTEVHDLHVWAMSTSQIALIKGCQKD